MAAREEFSARIKDQAWTRANGLCENNACGLPIQKGKAHFDHILPDALKGKPTLANCQVLCIPCHIAKTAQDVKRIRKADRQRKGELRIKTAPAAQIQNTPMPTTPRAAARREQAAATDKTRLGIGGRWVFGQFIAY